MNSEILEVIYKNLKDGDCLGFYRGGLSRYFIPVATHGKVTHCGICWDIKREDSKLSFNISEQLYRGGQFREIVIHKINNGQSYVVKDAYFIKQEKIYFRSLKKPLTQNQELIGKNDALSQIGKKYGYFSLLLGFEFLESLTPFFVKELILRLSKNHSKRICSTHCAIQYSKMGLIDLKKDFFYSPIEIISLPIFYDKNSTEQI